MNPALRTAVTAVRVALWAEAVRVIDVPGAAFISQDSNGYSGLYDPNTLTIGRRGEPDLTLNPGSNIEYLSSAATARCRTPGGHPEGFIEAFSNLYVDFANAVRAYPEPVDNVCATVGDGVRAMRFIRATINSTNNGSAWTKI